MNFITKKNFFMKLIVTFCIVIFLFNTICIQYSYGSWGGTLFKPIASLLTTVIIGINSFFSIILGIADDGVFSTITEALDSEEGTDSLNNLLVSPEKIFAGKYDILNINIFGETQNETSSSGKLIVAIKSAVAKTYYVFMSMGTAVLLCLLIYAGIRIILSANSPQERGKWQIYLMDWLKGLLLLFFIHVIMIAVLNIVDIVTNSINESISKDGTTLAAQCVYKIKGKRLRK